MDSASTLTLIGIFVTAVGSIASVVGIVLVLLQVRASQKIAKGEFLLHLAELLHGHDAAYQATLGLDWTPGNNGVSALDMENYMSLFEQFKVLLDYGIIDLEVFDRLYGYRVMLIVLNDFIFQDTLIKHAVGWPDFIQLAKVISRRQSRNPGPDWDKWADRWHNFASRTEQLQVKR